MYPKKMYKENFIIWRIAVKLLKTRGYIEYDYNKICIIKRMTIIQLLSKTFFFFFV